MAKKSKAKTTKKTTAKKAAKSVSKKAAKAPAKKIVKATSKKVAKAKSTKSLKAAKPAASNAGLKVGDSVPNFSLPATNGNEFQLKNFRGKNVVLYFYPKDATPGCTIQGSEFSAAIEKFKNANTEVFGISRDTLKSHENFKNKQNFKFDLLSDEDETACNLFDVIKEKNMYGKMVMGVERSTFLIDADGKLAKEWRKVKAEGHAEEVLGAIKS